MAFLLSQGCPVDQILVSDLELSSQIGITAQERENPQRLTVCLELTPRHGFDNLQDEISRTVDYFAVSQRVQQIAMERPRHLIETLAGEIAGAILREFAVAQVRLELRKYVLPDAEFVAVRLTRPMIEQTSRP